MEISGLLVRAHSIVRNEGPGTLVRNTCLFLRELLWKPVEDLYWNIRSFQTFSSTGVSVRVYSHTDDGGDVFRWQYRIEGEILDDLLSELRSDDVFFDIGANIGLFTCFAAEKLTSGKAIAFEPHPSNTAQLRRNIALNNLDNVNVLEIALGDSNDCVALSEKEDAHVGIGSGRILAKNRPESIRVKSRRGDDLIEKGMIPGPNIVKIDVEGAEPLAIQGIEKTLKNDSCRIVYCEIHLPTSGRDSVADYGYTPEEVVAKITDMGFSIEWWRNRGEEWHVKAAK